MPCTKPTLLLIPGTLCDERLFTRQRRVLRHMAHLHCANYNKLKNWEAWFAGLLSKLPAKFAVAGFSLGGLLALELLRRAPERISHLALIASNAEAASALTLRRTKSLRKLWLKEGASAVVNHSIPTYFHHHSQRLRQTKLMHRMAADTPRAAAFLEFAWAAQRSSGYAALHRFTGPVVVLSGGHDQVCPRHLQQALMTVQPKAVWHESQHSGHFLPLEAPAFLNRALTNWLNTDLTPTYN